LKANEKGKRNVTQELVLPIHEPQLDPTVLGKLSNEELLLWMKKIPENYYAVFNLFVVDGFSHQEIAKILRIDESLSRQRLSRGKAWLKDKLPDDFRSLYGDKKKLTSEATLKFTK
jgi:RNA polymerase sigma factor (sigma-70 family)